MELHARNCRIIHILWKPFSVVLSKTNTTAVTGYAVIHPFASFILLSNNKFISTLALLGNDVFVRRCDGIIYKHTLIYDRSIEWLSQKHVLYSMIIAVPFVFLTLIPSILLALYPTRIYSKYLSRCLSARKRLAITAFAEALHQCYKDGLNGSRDYRGLLSLFLVFFQCTRKLFQGMGYDTYHSEALSAFILCFIFSYVQPCKLAIANFSLGFYFLAFGFLYTAQSLWLYQLWTATDALELSIVIPPLLSHILAFGWAGYMLVCRILRCLWHGYRHKFTVSYIN